MIAWLLAWLTRPLTACKCAHAAGDHAHYTWRSYCARAACGCRRYRPTRKPPAVHDRPGARPGYQHPAAGERSPGAEAPGPPNGVPTRPPGLHIPTTLDCILACPACRQTPTGFCSCPMYCGHSYCGQFTRRDTRWLARLRIGAS